MTKQAWPDFGRNVPRVNLSEETTVIKNKPVNKDNYVHSHKDLNPGLEPVFSDHFGWQKGLSLMTGLPVLYLVPLNGDTNRDFF